MLKRHGWRSKQTDIRSEARCRKFGAGEDDTLTSLRIQELALTSFRICTGLPLIAVVVMRQLVLEGMIVAVCGL